jgi:predicted HTH domain antitoxin
MNETAILQITLSKEFLTLLGAKPQAVEMAREFIVLGMYQEGRISGGKAAELLGLTKQGFISLLARKGLDYFRLAPDEWADEVETVKAWKSSHA